MSGDQHPEYLIILGFADGSLDAASEERVAAHVQGCNECFQTYEELLELARLLKDPSVWSEPSESAIDYAAEIEAGRRDLQAIEDNGAGDARAADELLINLKKIPMSEWEAAIGSNPHVCTSALVHRLVAAADSEMFRKPDAALMLLRIAESVAYAVQPETAGLRCRGSVWNKRANVFRLQARYEDAVDAAIVAKGCFAELRTPDTPFEVGQVHYTIAGALFEMTRFETAMREVTIAGELLTPFGLSVPLAKVMMLEALIRAEQGDVVGAKNTLLTLLPIEEQLGHRLDVGRVWANLAECGLRLGDLDAATHDARAAITIFRELGNIAEETRGGWLLELIRLARGEVDALERLEQIARVYDRDLGMPGDAGFVKLDITAELLKRDEWAEAEALARELVVLFGKAGVTVASIEALHYLRAAVQNREATVAMLQYVRRFVAADDPQKPFEPPSISFN